MQLESQIEGKAELYFSNSKVVIDRISYLLLLLLCCFIFVNNWVSIFLWVLFIPLGCIYLGIEIRNHTLKLTKSSIFLLLIFVTSMVSLIVNWDAVVNTPVISFGRHVFYNRDVTILRLSYWLSAWVIASVVLPSLDLKETQIRMMLYVALSSVSVATIVGLIRPITGYDPLAFYQMQGIHVTRACGMYASTMTYAAVITLTAAFLLALANSKVDLSPRTRIPLIIALLLSLIGVFYSASLGAMVSILGSWLFCFVTMSEIFRPWKNWKPIVMALATLTLYIGIISITMTAPLRHNPYLGEGPYKYWYYSRVSTANLFLVQHIRFSQFKAAALLAMENPVWGAGFRNIDDKLPQVKKEKHIGRTKSEVAYQSHAHNNYLEILSGMGIFGFLAFVGFFISWYRESGVHRDLRLITGATIVSFLIMGLVHSTIVDSVYVFLLMLIYAMSQYVYKKTIQTGIPGA